MFLRHLRRKRAEAENQAAGGERGRVAPCIIFYADLILLYASLWASAVTGLHLTEIVWS
jgi:hypothetical protein